MNALCTPTIVAPFGRRILRTLKRNYGEWRRRAVAATDENWKGKRKSAAACSCGTRRGRQMGGTYDDSPADRYRQSFTTGQFTEGRAAAAAAARLKKTGPEAASWAPFGPARPGL